MKTIKHLLYNDSDFKILNINNKYAAYLSDFELIHENKKYEISIINKGSYGRNYIFEIDGETYVSDNIWQEESTNNNQNKDPKYTIEIPENVKKLNKLEYLSEKQRKKIIKKVLLSIKKKEKDTKQEFFSRYQYRLCVILSNSQLRIDVLSDIKDDTYYLKITKKEEMVWENDENELETKNFEEIVSTINEHTKYNSNDINKYPNVCNCYDRKIYTKINNKLNKIGRVKKNIDVKTNEYDKPMFEINFSSVKIKNK